MTKVCDHPRTIAKDQASLCFGKGKWNLIGDPSTDKKDDEDTVPKSSVQTQIDLHMEPIDNYDNQNICFIVQLIKIRNVARLSDFKKSLKKPNKAINIEALDRHYQIHVQERFCSN